MEQQLMTDRNCHILGIRCQEVLLCGFVYLVFFCCLYSFWNFQKALCLLKARQIIAEISVMSMGASGNRNASDWQFLWQQQNFQARKMCWFHHQMCQRLVSMTTATWIGKCMFMRFCFKSVLGYLRRKPLPNQYFFYSLIVLMHSKNKEFHLFQYFWESNIILNICITKRAIDLQLLWQHSWNNPKNVDVSNVFTLNLNIYFREQCIQMWKQLQSYLNFLMFLNTNQPAECIVCWKLYSCYTRKTGFITAS